jgi:hypothetical protein
VTGAANSLSSSPRKVATNHKNYSSKDIPEYESKVGGHIRWQTIYCLTEYLRRNWLATELDWRRNLIGDGDLRSR